MSKSGNSMMQSIRILVDVLLIVLGTCLIFSVIDLPGAPFWLGFVVLFAGGVLIFEDPSQRNLRIGIPLALFGAFLTLRSLNIISIPLLRWALGCFFLLTGAVNIYRNFKGGGVALFKTFQKNI